METLRARRRFWIASAGHLVAAAVTGTFAVVYGFQAIGWFRYPFGVSRFVLLLTVLLAPLAVTFGAQLGGLRPTENAIGRRALKAMLLLGSFVVVFLGVTTTALALTREPDCLRTNCDVFPAPWAYSLLWGSHILIASWFLALGLTWGSAGETLKRSDWFAAGVLLILAGVCAFVPAPLSFSLAHGFATAANVILGGSLARFARTQHSVA